MKSLKMTRLHIHYIFGKVTAIIILAVLFIFLMIFLFSSRAFEETSIQDLNRIESKVEYFHTMILAVKMLTTLVVCYLYGFNFLKHNDNYHVFCLSKNISKGKYFVSKALSISIIFFLIVGIIMILYFAVGLICTPWFQVTRSEIYFFILIYIQGVIYGLLTSFLTIILNSLYVGLISYGIFIINEIIIESVSSQQDLNLGVIIMRFVFPTTIITSTDIFLLYGVIQAIIVIIFQLYITGTFFKIKDLG